ncbi:MAG: hypothetical protein ACLR30_06985 [[Clostridium] leptum]
MKILVYDAPKTMRVDEAPDFPLGENDLRVQTLYSGMSHGTEMNVYRNLVPQFSKIYDPETRLLLPAEGQQAWTYPVKLRSRYVGLGYSNVGKVIEKGAKVAGFEIGDIVYSSSPHQTQVVRTPLNLLRSQRTSIPNM